MEGNENGNGHAGGYGKLGYKEIKKEDRIPDIRTEHSLNPAMYYRGTDLGDPAWSMKAEMNKQSEI